MELPPLTGVPRTSAATRLAHRAAVQSRGLLALGTVAAAAILLLFYERLSATAPITADSANAVLQGRAAAGGNVLLSGWRLSGASFYATDLPFYAAFSAIRGLSPAVAHDAAAAIYTLLVIAACFLARGKAKGGQGAGRMAVTLVLLLAPQPGDAAQLLLLGPFHAGTTLVLLLALLALDAAGERVWGAAVFGVLLALAVMSDALALYVGVVPAVAVSLLRLARRRTRADVAVLVAAALSVPAALAVLGVIQQAGGFTTVPLQGALAQIEQIPRNAGLTVEGILLLFGANFFGQPLGSAGTVTILVHMAGVALVLASCRSVLAGWRSGREPERVTQLLVAAMAVDLAAHLFSNQAIDLRTSRYLVPFMAFGAVLAGRVGADWLRAGRLRGAATAIAIAYVAIAVVTLRTPPASQPEAQLAATLEQRQLTYGLASYWQASTVTVGSRDRVRVRAVQLATPRPSPYLWEALPSWYDPAQPGNDARFVLFDTWDPRSLDRDAIEAAFGPPAGDFRVGRYEVLVWDRNLLDGLAT